jgi:hypothetical protein
MPIIGAKGSPSSGGFGQFARPSGPGTYIEDVFSTYLYTGNDSTQTITNGIDLSGNGGMVWVKSRSAAGNPTIIDTARGVNKNLPTNQTYAQDSDPSISSFNSNGFSINSLYSFINDTGTTYVSWTFRKQPKFFDIVTYTGNGTNYRDIAHNLGSAPGIIIIKATNDATRNWGVWSRRLAEIRGSEDVGINLNTQNAQNNYWFCNGASATTFQVMSFDYGAPTTVGNANGVTYVAYLFASNAGGFGLSGAENAITCGSVVGGSGAVNLGYEPQFVMIKNATASGEWAMLDTMRGWNVMQGSAVDQIVELQAQTDTGDVGNGNSTPQFFPTATGFNTGSWLSSGQTYIYIAIRRGPMKVPTTGTSVFAPVYEGSTTPAVQTSFPVDFGIWTRKDLTSDRKISSRLQGSKKMLTNSTSVEGSVDANLKWDYQNGYKVSVGASGDVDINWVMRRAPSFFDEVCWNGSGSGTPATVTHNLGVAPEMIIMFKRGTADVGIQGQVWTNLLTGNRTLYMFSDGGLPSWGNQAPTSVTATTFVSGYFSSPESTSNTFVAYLFATCPGVSKVGQYTGTGSTQTIACGFTGGARFVLLKRTDTTGDWYVWDTARGMVSGTDPSLKLNSTAAEVNANSIYTTTGGFQIVSTAAGINASGGTYLFLAIA